MCFNQIQDKNTQKYPTFSLPNSMYYSSLGSLHSLGETFVIRFFFSFIYFLFFI
uniref:Uncharacterized protein n=1 Tax=Myoviridae sp. ct3Pt8 TaxID=2826608 RepID=A0A8S5MMA4_9CAUD|nr:MAG TPA: hypothetical protein [Myoviridae sp. ct3Pt8]